MDKNVQFSVSTFTLYYFIGCCCCRLVVEVEKSLLVIGWFGPEAGGGGWLVLGVRLGPSGRTLVPRYLPPTRHTVHLTDTCTPDTTQVTLDNQLVYYSRPPTGTTRGFRGSRGSRFKVFSVLHMFSRINQISLSFFLGKTDLFFRICLKPRQGTKGAQP